MAPDLPRRILIVDDEPNMLHMLGSILKHDGFEAVAAASANEALELASREEFDFVLSDVRMPGMDGIQLLEHLRAVDNDAIVILMSAYGSTDLALEAMRKGAYDYISKPFKTDEVVLTLRKAAERERLRREVAGLKRRLSRTEAGRVIIAESPALRDILRMVEQIAPYESSVLITGESGTGKEVIAREIHRRSPRSEESFVALNCAAIPSTLLESELFGHAKGAYTGANSLKTGLFEEADRGALFLDEIGAMDVSLQAKLLRAIDAGEVRRLGETVTRLYSVRILAATNEELDSAIEKGRFRSDLYYRLNVVRIHVPPLRERKEDIMPLVEHFVNRFNRVMGLKVRRISREAREAFLKYPWRGNVRELENVIERSMILAGGESIELNSLPHDMGEAAPGSEDGLTEPAEGFSMKKSVKKLERDLISRALKATGGNRAHAAKLLEISYTSLRQKVRDYGLV